jgi:hypothetical protein
MEVVRRRALAALLAFIKNGIPAKTQVAARLVNRYLDLIDALAFWWNCYRDSKCAVRKVLQKTTTVTKIQNVREPRWQNSKRYYTTPKPR